MPVPGVINPILDFSATADIKSAEARNGGSGFGTDVDDFMDPTFHNAKIGTFMLLGGFIGTNTEPRGISVGYGTNRHTA